MPKKTSADKKKTTAKKAETARKAESPRQREKVPKVPVSQSELSQGRKRGTPGAGSSPKGRKARGK